MCYYTNMEIVLCLLETEVILQNTHKRTANLSQAEDLALKSAAAYFGDEMIQWLGIEEKVLRAAPTEIVELEARHRYEDFLYEMENGSYYHFEFESDAISEKDLKRFREYEASTARLYNAPVITYVICSSQVKHLQDSITEGINTYRVKLIRLKDTDADLILERFSEKQSLPPDRKDIIPLLFAPLMGGRSDRKERMLKSIEVLRSAENVFSRNDIQKMEAILYTFAVKFLDENDLKSIKEAISMTKLGQMIWNDALEQGRKEGRTEGQEQASDRYSRLILLLSEDNRTDLIIKIASDPEYREALYKEYGI